MGTNYYWYEKPPCSNCKRPYEPLHIGKSSGGWCFSLHVIPERKINDLEDWEHLWRKNGSFIEDEYGQRVPADIMLDKIVNRSGECDNQWSKKDYQQNYAEPGPHGLARHILGYHCIKHGEGTWDCIIGEFS